jgi:hypothetical protein
LPVAWAVFKPVRIRPVVVSNAAVPGRPAVSFAGNVSLTSCQMSEATRAEAHRAAGTRLAGHAGRSTNATDTLSK